MAMASVYNKDREGTSGWSRLYQTVVMRGAVTAVMRQLALRACDQYNYVVGLQRMRQMVGVGD